MSIETELDVATKELLDNVAAEDAQRPDEPSLPFGEWARKNLFSSVPNGILTVIFAVGAVFAYSRLLNFIFSEERTWNAVRVNLRNLFTASYPGSQYNRIWVTLAVVFVLTGLSMGLMKTIGRGFSAKRISMWFMSFGIAIVAGIVLREPSVLKDENGLAQWVLPNGDFVARDDAERLITTDADGESLLGVGEEVSLIRESFLDAMADRGLWWLAGLLSLAVGLALWFGLGSKRGRNTLLLAVPVILGLIGAFVESLRWLRPVGLAAAAIAVIWFSQDQDGDENNSDHWRRNTFVPAIPLGLGIIGLLISSVWWYEWGHFGRDTAGELVIEPGRLVAASTQIPFTVLWFILVAAYVLGRMVKDHNSAIFGALAASVAIGVAEALAGLVDNIPSLVGEVSAFIADNAPGDAAGTSQPVLAAAVIVIGVLLGAWAGISAEKNFQTGVIVFAAAAVVGVLFSLSESVGLAIVAAVVGAAAGLGLLYLLLNRDKAASKSGNIRALVNFSWLLAPFVTYFVILRDPDLDWDHVWSTHIPMAIAFMVIGGAILWALTSPGIGERGRLIAAGLVFFSFYNWAVAFFGRDGITEWDETWSFLEPVRWIWNTIFFPVIDWLVSGHFLDRLPSSVGESISSIIPLVDFDEFGFTHMLQKGRISFLLLGLVALMAHNFAGDARQRLKLVYAWIGLIAVVHYLITMINTAATVAAPDEFAGGFVVTMYIAIFTMIFSFPLGILLALGRTSQMPLFRVMSTVYIEVVRGIPFITILFFFAVFVEFFLPEGMELAGLAAAGIGFSLFSAAYLAENIRGGLQSIRRGQYEASDAMGLTTVQRTGFIVLPQALRASIPPLVGAAIATFKETSLLSIVGIIDFLRVANSSIPGQTDFVGVKREGLLFVCLIYWIGSYAMSKYSQRLEKQLGVGER